MCGTQTHVLEKHPKTLKFEKNYFEKISWVGNTHHLFQHPGDRGKVSSRPAWAMRYCLKKKKDLFLFQCIWVFCLNIHLCTTCAWWPQRLEKSIRSPGNRVTDSCGLPQKCWDPWSSPLEDGRHHLSSLIPWGKRNAKEKKVTQLAGPGNRWQFQAPSNNEAFRMF